MLLRLCRVVLVLAVAALMGLARMVGIGEFDMLLLDLFLNVAVEVVE